MRRRNRWIIALSVALVAACVGTWSCGEPRFQFLDEAVSSTPVGAAVMEVSSTQFKGYGPGRIYRFKTSPDRLLERIRSELESRGHWATWEKGPNAESFGRSGTKAMEECGIVICAKRPLYVDSAPGFSSSNRQPSKAPLPWDDDVKAEVFIHLPESWFYRTWTDIRWRLGL